jgi:hypothetical protein
MSSPTVALAGSTAHHDLILQHVQASLLATPTTRAHALSAASAARSLASLSSARADSFFPALLAALTADPHASAPAVAVAARDSPPALLRPHWVALARRTAAALKASPAQQAPLLAAFAAIIAAAEPYGALGGPAVAAVAAVAESALAHALPVLVDTDGAFSSDDSLAAVALAAAVAHVAPNQIRAFLIPLSDALWAPDRGLSSPCPAIRTHSAALLAALPVCHPAKARATALVSLTLRAAKEMDELRQSLAMFQPRSAAPAQAVRPVPLPQHAQQQSASLAARFTTMVDLLCACLNRTFPDPLTFPVDTLAAILVRVLDFASLDPYALPAGQHIDVTSVAILLPRIRADSLRALCTVVRALGRPALLPFASVLVRPVARCLSVSAQLSSAASAQFLIAGLSERAHAYNAAISCISILGSSAIEALAAPLAATLSSDIPEACIISTSSSAAAVNTIGHLPLHGLAHSSRSAKRRRHNGGGGSGKSRQDDQEDRRTARESFMSASYDPIELQGIHAVQPAAALVEATIVGLTAFQAMLSSRSFMSDACIRSIVRVESLIVAAIPSARGELGCALVRVTAACALSGGSGRLCGRSSSLLIPALSALRALIRSPSASGMLAFEARVALASCEALVHPKGPPVILSSVAATTSIPLTSVALAQVCGLAEGQLQSNAEMLHSLPKFDTSAIKRPVLAEPEAMEQDEPQPSPPNDASRSPEAVQDKISSQPDAHKPSPNHGPVLSNDLGVPATISVQTPMRSDDLGGVVNQAVTAKGTARLARAAGSTTVAKFDGDNSVSGTDDEDVKHATDQDAEDEEILNSLVFD